MTAFDESVLNHDRARRRELLGIVDDALVAVNPQRAMAKALADTDVGSFERIVVLGLGKASIPMGRAVASSLGSHNLSGVLVSNSPEAVPPFEVIRGEHPIPGAGSVEGGIRILKAASGIGSNDLALVLISGGGSALVTVPVEPLTINDLQATTDLLLRSGATINEVNTVRKHLSAFKGGRLAEALDGAGAVSTFILSDVIGNPLDVIASGPTVPDPTTFEQALEILELRGIASTVPGPVVDHLRSGAAGTVPDTPTGGDVFERQTIRLVADAATAAQAAAASAKRRGWTPTIVTTELEGEARVVGADLADQGCHLAMGSLLIYAGEPTVTVTGSGLGGRNQELALAASIALQGREDVTLVAVGTDGIDGKSDAAGGFASGSSVRRGEAMGLDAADFLDRNDSNRYLSAVGDVVICGPTGTNVGDLILVARSG